VVGHGAEWGVDARYSWEPIALGSAGGPRRALPLLDADRFLIVNGDTITDCDLKAIVAQHLESKALVTMAVVTGDVQRYGGVIVDANGAVQSFGKSAGALHFIGVQAVNRAAFAGVPDSEPSETVKQLYPELIARRHGSVRAHVSSASFLDIGTPADYFTTVDRVAAAEQVPLDRGSGCVVDPTATVAHSILWDRVRVGENAQLIDCIVGDDVTVPAAVRYERSVIVAGDDGLIAEKF
jgi:mannose-1-phosphate guanylyltransferase